MPTFRILKALTLVLSVSLAVFGQPSKLEVVVSRDSTFDAVVERTGEFRFSPNGSFIYILDDAGKLSVWDTASRTLRYSIDKKLKAVMFSPDDKSVFIAGKKEAQIVDALTGNAVSILEKKIESLPFAKWSPNSQYLAANIADFNLGVFDAANGKLKSSYLTHEKKKLAVSRFFDDADASTSVVFTPDSRRLLTSNDDPEAEMWEIETGSLIFTFTQKLSFVYGDLRPKPEPVMSGQISADGKWVVTSTFSDARLWNAETGKLVQKFDGYQTLEFTADSRYLGLLNDPTNRATTILDLETMKTRQLFSKYSGAFAIWSPDGRTILTDRTIDEVNKEEAYIWDFETGKQLASVNTYAKYCFDYVSTCLSDSDRFTFSPNSKTLLSFSKKQVKLLNARNGSLLTEITGAAGPAFWSSDGKFILAKDKQKGKISMWRLTVKES